MHTGSSLLSTLQARGLLFQHTEGLAEHLSKGSLTAYCGFDPTASSLHVGNLVPVMVLRRLAEAGHKVVAIVGGGTAMIGDPSGKSTERPLLTEAEVQANADAIGAQLQRLVGGRVEMINNAEWLSKLGMIEFLREVGKHFPINQMLAKDTVKSRLETGISYTEFSYMLLQAYDFLQLNKTRDVSLQVGGSDQWGNITAGTELIRRASSKEAHALTTPLLLTASGKKFGKTEEGAVWLDPQRTTPSAFHQYWLTTDDADALRFLKIFTSLSDDDLKVIDHSIATEPHLRRAQKTLAEEMTTLVHGGTGAARAQQVSDVLYAKDADYQQLSNDELQSLHASAGKNFTPVAGQPINVIELIATALEASKREARTLVQQGSISINGQRLGADRQSLESHETLHGRWIIVKRGAKKIVVVDTSAP